VRGKSAVAPEEKGIRGLQLLSGVADTVIEAHEDIVKVYSTSRLEGQRGMSNGHSHLCRKLSKHFDSMVEILYSSILVWEVIYEEISMHGSRADVTLHRVVPVGEVLCV
jgi:hypothetical protein